MGRLLLGTSGYGYKHWKGVFYPSELPQSRWLEFYCQHFDSVELNVTFYRLPKRQTFEGWYQRTPPHFLFAAKGSRFITHIKKLQDCREPLRAYRENAAGLGEKLAIILWQLPPNLQFGRERLAEFCRLLGNEYPEKRHVFEFRHESWLKQDCYDILAFYGFALCIPVSPHYPRVEQMTAPFSYVRFHGGEVLGNSCYTEEELTLWATKIKEWFMVQDLYIYFNNDTQGFSIDNAIKLINYLNIS